MGLRVLVCGGRKLKNAEMIGACLGGIQKQFGIDCIITGGAPGADWLAAAYGRWQNIPVAEYPANWKLHGRAAGPIRNQRMLDEAKPDIVVAFPGGRGTADMVSRAEKAGVRVYRSTLTLQEGE